MWKAREMYLTLNNIEEFDLKMAHDMDKIMTV